MHGRAVSLRNFLARCYLRMYRVIQCITLYLRHTNRLSRRGLFGGFYAVETEREHPLNCLDLPWAVTQTASTGSMLNLMAFLDFMNNFDWIAQECFALAHLEALIRVRWSRIRPVALFLRLHTRGQENKKIKKLRKLRTSKLTASTPFDPNGHQGRVYSRTFDAQQRSSDSWRS